MKIGACNDSDQRLWGPETRVAKRKHCARAGHACTVAHEATSGLTWGVGAGAGACVVGVPSAAPCIVATINGSQRTRLRGRWRQKSWRGL